MMRHIKLALLLMLATAPAMLMGQRRGPSLIGTGEGRTTTTPYYGTPTTGVPQPGAPAMTQVATKMEGMTLKDARDNVTPQDFVVRCQQVVRAVTSDNSVNPKMAAFDVKGAGQTDELFYEFLQKVIEGKKNFPAIVPIGSTDMTKINALRPVLEAAWYGNLHTQVSGDIGSGAKGRKNDLMDWYAAFDAFSADMTARVSWQGKNVIKNPLFKGKSILENPNDSLAYRIENVQKALAHQYLYDLAFILTKGNPAGQFDFDTSGLGKTNKPAAELLIAVDALGIQQGTPLWNAMKEVLQKCKTSVDGDLQDTLKGTFGGRAKEADQIAALYAKYLAGTPGMAGATGIFYGFNVVKTPMHKGKPATQNPNDSLTSRKDKLAIGNFAQTMYDYYFVLTGGNVPPSITQARLMFDVSGFGRTDAVTAQFIIAADGVLTQANKGRGTQEYQMLKDFCNAVQTRATPPISTKLANKWKVKLMPIFTKYAQ